MATEKRQALQNLVERLAHAAGMEHLPVITGFTELEAAAN
jgi:hypothetical protein